MNHDPYEIYKHEFLCGNRKYLYKIPEEFRTKELCEIAVNKLIENICDVPDHLVTNEMCEKAINIHGKYLPYIPKHMRTEERCNLAILSCPEIEKYAPPGTSVGNNYMMKKALL